MKICRFLTRTKTEDRILNSKLITCFSPSSNSFLLTFESRILESSYCHFLLRAPHLRFQFKTRPLYEQECPYTSSRNALPSFKPFANLSFSSIRHLRHQL